MEYPLSCTLKIPHIFANNDVIITLNSNVTTFVGPNGTGKTQTLKSIKRHLENNGYQNKVRYLSSNRIGVMEQYRSKVDQYTYSQNDFHIGNMGDRKLRKSIETATGDFFTLDEKRDVFIKVSERLSVMFHRKIILKWDAGNLKIFFEKTDTQQEYSAVVEASGLLNIISILTALYDDDIEILLIDEPEVSLHPQLQSYLLREIQKASIAYSKTVIISTHSTEMISFTDHKDISNLVFFSDDKLPLQIAITNEILNNTKLQDFIIRISQTHKTGFFAKKILLVEGISDLTICKALSHSLDLNTDVAGSHIIPVEGKGQLPILHKFFSLIGKEIAILTDLDGFIDDNSIVNLFNDSPIVKQEVHKLAHPSLIDMCNRTKTNFTTQINKPDNSLSRICENHPYYSSPTDPQLAEKMKKRAALATLLTSTDTEIENWHTKDNYDWSSLKTQIITVLDTLNKAGCFVLRKGALESYYIKFQEVVYDDKVSKAMEEASTILTTDKAVLKNKYEDVIKALNHISSTRIIDESIAVKIELASELSPFLLCLKNNSDKNEILSNIRQAKGNVSSLFDYEIQEIDNQQAVTITLKSPTLDASGFPLTIKQGQDVNAVIDNTIKPTNL